MSEDRCLVSFFFIVVFVAHIQIESDVGDVMFFTVRKAAIVLREGRSGVGDVAIALC